MKRVIPVEVVHPRSLWKLTVGARIIRRVLFIDDEEVVGPGRCSGPYLTKHSPKSACSQLPGPHNGRSFFFPLLNQRLSSSPVQFHLLSLLTPSVDGLPGLFEKKDKQTKK